MAIFCPTGLAGKNHVDILDKVTTYLSVSNRNVFTISQNLEGNSNFIYFICYCVLPKGVLIFRVKYFSYLIYLGMDPGINKGVVLKL